MTTTVTIPGALAPAPYPCNTEILGEWLNHHFGTMFGNRVRLSEIMTVIENRYGEGIPLSKSTPYPSDVWNHVVKQEKQIRGGQAKLSLPGLPTRTPVPLPSPLRPQPVSADEIVRLARGVRSAQRAYFADRTAVSLATSKRLEGQLDAALSAYEERKA